MAPLGDGRSSVPATNPLAQIAPVQIHMPNRILAMGMAWAVVLQRFMSMAESSTPIIIGPPRSRQQWHTEEQ